MNDTLTVIATVAGTHWLAYKWGYLGVMGHVLWIVFKSALNFEGGKKPKPIQWRHSLSKWTLSLGVYWFLIVLWKEQGLQWLLSWATDSEKLLEPWAAGPITPYSVMLAFSVHPFLMLVFNALTRPHDGGQHPALRLITSILGKRK